MPDGPGSGTKVAAPPTAGFAHLRLRDLIPAVAFLTSASAVQILVAFAANLVLVRLLTPEEFGRFALVYAGAQLAFSILTLRINVLVIRTRDAEFTPERQDLYYTALVAETLLASLVALLWYAAFEQPTLWDAILVAAVAGSHWINQNKAFFERTMPYRKLAVIEAISAGAAHVMSVVLAVAGLGAASLYLREAVLVLFNGAGLALVGGLTRRTLRRPRLAEVKALLAEARGVWLDSMLEASFQRISILVTGALLGERGAGLLFQAQRLAVVPHQFLTPLVTRIAPNWFGRLETFDRQVAARRALLRLLALPLGAGVVVTLLFHEPMVAIILGAQWLEAAPAFAAMAGMVLFLSLFDAMRGYCLSAKRTRILFAARVAQYGAYGAVLIPVLAGGAAIDLATLGLALSAAFGAAFTTGELLLRWREGARQACAE